MPPKKKPNTGIDNMYERIPKKFLTTTENPNFDIHHIKLPCRVCICAPSGSGKTNFLISLLEKFSVGKGTFHSICIVTRNADEPLYRWLASVNDQIRIVEGLENTPILDKFDKDLNHIVVFDDLVLEKNLSRVQAYYIRARKLNCSVFFLSQTYFGIPKLIRNNCTYLVLLRLSGHREVNMILSEGGLGCTKEQLLGMYLDATKEKFGCLIIDYEEEPQNRYRKGLTETLDPNNFSSTTLDGITF